MTERLHKAALALYMAGRWECTEKSPQEQAALWEELRDALGLTPGTATREGVASNVVQLHKPKGGDLAFMCCPCSPEDPEAFLPVAVVGEHPIIAALVCPACECQVDVVNGIVQK
jgi:hypothetical protein